MIGNFLSTKNRGDFVFIYFSIFFTFQSSAFFGKIEMLAAPMLTIHFLYTSSQKNLERNMFHSQKKSLPPSGYLLLHNNIESYL